jgi:hypothetical protein
LKKAERNCSLLSSGKGERELASFTSTGDVISLNSLSENCRLRV